MEKIQNTAVTSTAWDGDKPAAKSFGDHLKESAHWWATEIGVNYVANATVSVGLTYLFEKTRGEQYKAWLKDNLKNIKNPKAKGVAAFIIKFLTKSQLLLMGGHLLVPLMKDFNDNRHRQTEWMGDKLDAIQELLGMGNEASRNNRQDYAHLHALLKEKPKDLSSEDIRVLVKYGVNQSFDFIEEKRTWSEVIRSRLRAVGFSAATNSVIGATEGLTEKNGVENTGLYSRGWANFLSKNLGKGFGKIPGFKKVFSDTELFAREYANDMILTGASTIGFMQGMKAAEKDGPSHADMLDRNKEQWASRIQDSNKDVATVPTHKKILEQERANDMASRLQAERDNAAQQDNVLASR